MTHMVYIWNSIIFFLILNQLFNLMSINMTWQDWYRIFYDYFSVFDRPLSGSEISRCFLRIWIWLVQFFCSPTSHLKFLVTFLPSFVYLAGRFLFVCCSLFHSADVCNLDDFLSWVFWIYNFFLDGLIK